MKYLIILIVVKVVTFTFIHSEEVVNTLKWFENKGNDDFPRVIAQNATELYNKIHNVTYKFVDVNKTQIKNEEENFTMRVYFCSCLICPTIVFKASEEKCTCDNFRATFLLSQDSKKLYVKKLNEESKKCENSDEIKESEETLKEEKTQKTENEKLDNGVEEKQQEEKENEKTSTKKKWHDFEADKNEIWSLADNATDIYNQNHDTEYKLIAVNKTEYKNKPNLFSIRLFFCSSTMCSLTEFQDSKQDCTCENFRAIFKLLKKKLNMFVKNLDKEKRDKNEGNKQRDENEQIKKLSEKDDEEADNVSEEKQQDRKEG